MGMVNKDNPTVMKVTLQKSHEVSHHAPAQCLTPIQCLK